MSTSSQAGASRSVSGLLLKVIAAAVLALAVFSAICLTDGSDVSEASSSGTTGDCTWTLSDDGVLTVSGTGAMDNYDYGSALPWGSSVESVSIGDSVTSIGNYAFRGCTSLASAAIGSSVKTIGSYAFDGCTSLASVTLGNSVTSIGDGAFFGGTTLSSVAIPDSVTSIGDYAFYGCTTLASFSVSEGNTAYCSADGVLYSKDMATLVQYPAGKDTSEFTLPSSVISIGSYAFYYCTSLASVSIPDSVTSVGDHAFYGCTSLASVTIGSSVTSIGSYAFFGCTSLASVTVPDSVTSIGSYAFFGCTSLASVTLGNSVTSIGSYAFSGCIHLASISVSEGNTAYCSADGVLYSKDMAILIQYPAGKNTSEFTIPSSVTSIGSNAFDGCTSLVSVAIGNSVTSVEEGAFNGCTHLTSVTIPDSVKTIGYGAFESCRSLASVTIGSSVTSIGSYAFDGCTSLASVTVPDSVTLIGSYAFSGCTSLASVTLGNSVTSIGSYAFLGCTNLKTVANNSLLDICKGSESYGHVAYYADTVAGQVMSGTGGDYSVKYNDTSLVCGIAGYTGSSESLVIPSVLTIEGAYYSVVAIDGSVFQNQAGLKSVTIPDSVTSIGDYVFSGCTSLASVTLGNSVTSIGDRAFDGCTSLASVTIPDSVASIGSYAFNGCTSLASVTLGNSVTSIGDGAFFGCTTLSSVVIPDTVTSIGDYAFYGCTTLVSVTLGNSVTSIGRSAFSRCTALSSVVIPDSVTSIGDYAFYGCTTLASFSVSEGNISYCSADGVLYSKDMAVLIQYPAGKDTSEFTIPSSVISLGYDAFYGCTPLTSVTIPDSVTYIGSYAFSGCTALSSVAIPDSVTSIRGYTFYECTSLRSVTIGKSVSSIGSCAFEGCTSLVSVALPDSVTTVEDSAFIRCTSLASVIFGSSVTTIGDRAFHGCTSLASVTVPDSVTSIGTDAFSGCTSLASATVGSSVTSVGVQAFSGCTSLVSVTFGGSVASVGSYAFHGCEILRVITFGSTEPPTLGTNVLPEVSAGRSAGCLHYIIVPSGSEDGYRSAWTSYSDIIVSGFGDGKTWREQVVDSYTGDDFSYTLYLGGKLVVGGSSIPDYAFSSSSSYFGNYALLVGEVEISDSVTHIGDDAFYGCKSLSSMTIPGSVTHIGDGAFSGCRSLLSVTISDSVTTIGNSAFSGCISLASVTIPDSVTNIESYAFCNCTSLVSVTIGSSVTNIGDYAFYECTGLKTVANNSFMDIIKGSESNGYAAYYADAVNGQVFTGTSGDYSVKYNDAACICIIQGYTGSSETLDIPSVLTIGGADCRVVAIDGSVFQNQAGLKSVTIPDSVTSVEDSAFNGCTSLASVTIPDSVTSVGSYAFYGCTSLASVTLGNSVTSVGSFAFDGCTSLVSVTLGCSVASVGDYAFSDCTGLRAVVIMSAEPPALGTDALPPVSMDMGGAIFRIIVPSGSIDSYKSAWTSYSDFILPGLGDGSAWQEQVVDSYASDNFSYTLYLGGKLAVDGTSVPACAFRYSDFGDYPLVAEVEIASSVKTIGDDAFSGCSFLTSVTIPDSVTSIGSGAFYQCTSLASATLGNSVTSIGDSAFSGCTSLAFLTIGSSVVSIGYEAFYYCLSLTSVAIPDSVTSIGGDAFYECTSLASVTIGSSVTDIGDYAFYECTNLKTVANNTLLHITKGSASYGYVAYYADTVNGQVQTGTSGDYTVEYNDAARVCIIQGYTGSAETLDIPSVLTIGGADCRVVAIDMSAFAGQVGMKSVTILDSVASVGDCAFEGCISLASVTIGSSVTSIGTNAFYGCTSLASVAIPDSVTSIGDHAFDGCTSLASATIGSSVISIGTSAFYGCTSLASVAIPDSVTSIGEYAFCSCISLASVTIGSSVTSIGNDAFSGCTSLASMTLGSSVASIGGYAFCNCASLKSLTVPDSVASIGNSAFSGCTSLESVSVSAGNTSYCSVDGVLYSKDMSTLVLYPSGRTAQTYDIPDSVTVIGNYAFTGCSSITSIAIPDSVTSVGSNAFYRCTSLVSVTFGGSVASVGGYAFSGGTPLRAVTFGSAEPPMLGTDALPSVLTKDGGTLAYIIVPSGSEDGYRSAWTPYSDIIVSGFADGKTWQEQVVDSYTGDGFSYTLYLGGKLAVGGTSVPADAFSSYGSDFGNYSLLVGEVEISDSVTYIGDFAFSGCEYLSSVTIPGSVTSIGDYAFSGCTNLKTVANNSFLDISKGSESCGYVAYYADTVNGQVLTGTSGDYSVKYNDAAHLCIIQGYSGSSETLGIPSVLTIGGADCRVVAIDGSAFRDQTALESVTIPDSVTSIGDNAFYGCTSLVSLAIPDSVVSVGDHAFYGCTSLASVTIGNSVTSVGYQAFYGCTSLASVTIGSSVTSIGDDAFYRCTSLASVTIPDSVTSIGISAFSVCTSLASVTIPDSVTSIGISAFYGCTSLASVTIGSSVTSIGDDAFYGCTSIASVTIPGSVTSVGISAFYGCTHLRAVIFRSAEPPILGTDALPSVSLENGGNIYRIFVPSASVDEYKSAWASYSDIVVPGLEDGKTWQEQVVDSYTGDGFSYTLCLGGKLFIGGTSVPADAFRYSSYGNYALLIGEVEISDSVETIGDGAFYGCNNLVSFSVSDGNAAYCSVDGVLYSKDMAVLVRYPAGKGVSELAVPSSATSIGNYAFSGCASLSSVTIGNSVKSIGDYAFFNCASIASVTIGSSVISIGDYAFDGCTSIAYVVNYSTLSIAAGSNGYGFVAHYADFVYGSADGSAVTEFVQSDYRTATSVIIPGSVTSVGSGAFRGCTSLASISVSAGNTSYCSVDGVLYSRNMAVLVQYPAGKGTSEFAIPSSVTSIGDYAFYGCTSLASVTIPDSVTSIGEKAFKGCTGLKTVANNSLLDISKGSESYGYAAYYADTVNGQVLTGTSGDYSVKYNDTSLICIIRGYTGSSETLGIPSVLTVEGADCRVVAIGESAFQDQTALKSVAILDSVTSIEIFAFNGCTSLVSVTIGDSVTSIGIFAFSGCTSLASVSFGSSVASIGDYAFSGCTFCDPEGRELSSAEDLAGHLFHGKDSRLCMADSHTPGDANTENAVGSTCESEGSYDSVVRCTVCGAVVSSEHITVPRLTPAAVDDSSSAARVTVADGTGIQRSDVERLAAEAESDASKTLEVTAGDAVISLDNTALKNLDTTRDISVSVDRVESVEIPDTKGTSVVYQVSLGDNHTFNGGKVTITLPYDGPTDNLKVYYLVDGEVQETLSCTYADGKVTFTVDHLSTFAIAQAQQADNGGSSSGGMCSSTIALMVISVLAVVAVPVIRYIRF